MTCKIKLYITPKCVVIHSKFHYILSEFGHFYHGEISQPLSEQGPVATDKELIHQYLVKQGYYKMKQIYQAIHLLVN